MINELEVYFSSERKWDSFVDVYSEDWDEYDKKAELVNALQGYVDFAIVIAGIDDFPMEFINNKMDLLDGLSPLECLEKESLRKRLKVFLMRYPT